MTDTAPPPAPGAPQGKKGLPGWAWVAIGCGGLILVGFIAFAALGIFAVKKGAEFAKEKTGVESLEEFKKELEQNPAKISAETAIRLNPELEIVESDESEGTITFKNVETGEVATFDYEDIADGKFSLTTEEGEFSVEADESGAGGVVFRGPEGETRIGGAASLDDVPEWVPLYPNAEETEGTFGSRTAQRLNGAVTMTTTDTAQEVVAHYKEWFEEEGWTLGSESMTTAGDGAFGMISGELPDENRTINVGVIAQGDSTRVTVNYEEKIP